MPSTVDLQQFLFHAANYSCTAPSQLGLDAAKERRLVETERVTRIIIADDCPAVRLGTRLILEQDRTNQVVAEAADVDQMMSACTARPVS